METISRSCAITAARGTPTLNQSFQAIIPCFLLHFPG